MNFICHRILSVRDSFERLLVKAGEQDSHKLKSAGDRSSSQTVKYIGSDDPARSTSQEPDLRTLELDDPESEVSVYINLWSHLTGPRFSRVWKIWSSCSLLDITAISLTMVINTEKLLK